MQTEAVAPISAVVFGSIPCLLSVLQAALMPHLRQSCARSQGVFLKAHSGERLQICLKLNGCDFVGASSPEWHTGPQKSHSVISQHHRNHTQWGGAGLSAPLSLDHTGCHVHHLWEGKARGRGAA